LEEFEVGSLKLESGREFGEQATREDGQKKKAEILSPSRRSKGTGGKKLSATEGKKMGGKVERSQRRVVQIIIHRMTRKDPDQTRRERPIT